MAMYESIEFELIEKEGPIEIRKYDTILLASAKTAYNPKMDNGFSKVFRYIAGGNESNQKIKMTVPVVNYKEDDDGLVTGFYVPKAYSKDTVPKPLGDVYIDEINAAYYAVIKFRGTWREKNFSKQDNLLRTYLDTHNISIISKQFIMRYNPPFIPAFLRHNEILYQIDYKK